MDNRFSRQTPMSTTLTSSSISSAGGFSPIPIVRAELSGGMVTLSWDAPEDYAGAMNPGPVSPTPASPLKGVRVWQFSALLRDGLCTSGPSGDDPGWVSIGTVELPTTTMGPLSLPPAGWCRFYALSVRFKGPGVDSDPTSEIETGAKAGALGSPMGFVGV